jgi:outer membrane protein assembly factor BamB
VLTPNLFLHALDAATGRSVWRHELLKEYGGKNIQWKNAASPVVEGELVMVAIGSGGGSYLAFNRTTGTLAWKAGNEALTHSTPAIATIQGVRQVIFIAQSGLVALGLDGRPLWKHPFKFDTSTAISPVVSGDIVYCSAGYGVGGGACRVAKTGNGFSATQLWYKPGNKDTANHWSTPVVIDGHLYGMFGFKLHNTGPMKCVDIATGAVKWEKPGFGQGNLIVTGGRILALAEDCSLVAIAPSPAGYQEVARTKVLSGKCWSTPAYADGRVYIRGTDDGACLELGGR